MRMMKCINSITNLSGIVRSIKYMEALSSLIIASDKKAKIWKINMENIYIDLPHNDEVLDILAISEKLLIITACKDGSISLWN